MDEYAEMLKKLRKKIQVMEEPEAPVPDTPKIPGLDNMDEKKDVSPKVPTMGPQGEIPRVPPDLMVDTLTDIRLENSELRHELTDYKIRIDHLGDEVHSLREALANQEHHIQHYRDMIQGLKGNCTVINKYNYRFCAKNPETGEWEYRLIKLPPDFDPFNPSTITPDGREIFEEYSLEVPTRLGDIIRREFSQEEMGEYTTPYWSPAPAAAPHDENTPWEIKKRR